MVIPAGVRSLVTAALVLAAAVSAAAGEHPTIHHAGVVQSVNLAAGIVVLDEALRLSPPLITHIEVTEETAVVKVIRVEGEFRGQRVTLQHVNTGDYVVVRGVDRADRHHAEMIWSLGPAR